MEHNREIRAWDMLFGGYEEEQARKQAQEDYINDTGGDAELKYARFILTALAEEAGISLAELRRELAFMRLWTPPDETD